MLHRDAEHVALQSADIQVVVHAIPQHIADTFEISVPPTPRGSPAMSQLAEPDPSSIESTSQGSALTPLPYHTLSL